ncbi:hypothetical protein Ddye_029665 [Dipteronia dyeriana]|uniref:Uncharacterized protein n=1 Tax=Dipteronia dyeriana TaxID=168575 RepID=A0AAD9TFJ9_9ROSI|nr:hypothetical protein Ddye_029665 [Dipteronia dyeriana]
MSAPRSKLRYLPDFVSSVLLCLQTSLKHHLQLSNVIPRIQEAPHQLSIVWLTLDSLENTSQNLTITYLGCPLGGSPNKLAFWEPVVGRIRNRLTHWKKKIISKGWRLVLIKTVLASIPDYYMLVLRMSEGGDRVEKRKLHLVRWDSICKSKKNGGLGVARIMDMNLSL